MLHLLGQIGIWTGGIITIILIVICRPSLQQQNRFYKTGRITAWLICPPLGLYRTIKHDADVRAERNSNH